MILFYLLALLKKQTPRIVTVPGALLVDGYLTIELVSSLGGFCTIRQSVVNRRAEIETAFSRAVLVTLTGSIIPALIMSTYSSVLTFIIVELQVGSYSAGLN